MLRATRPCPRVSSSILALLALVAFGCSADDPFEPQALPPGVEDPGPSTGEVGPEAPSTTRAATDGAVAPYGPQLAEGIRPLPPAGGIPAIEPAGPTPVGLRIDALGVQSAAVRAVGVEPDGEMEVPGPTEVGWYGFGPAPGQTGSAVLAAHIAADGVDGVFRHLAGLEAGDRVEVLFDDGAIEVFEVVALRRYGKERLPFDDLFARDGDPRLALITCGGDFNPSLRSYEDNVVAYALPV